MTTWGSTTPSIRSAIQKALDDGAFETSGGMYSYLLPWANDVVMDICNELVIPMHLYSDTTGVAFSAANSGDAPANFLKKSQFTKARVGTELYDLVRKEEVYDADPDRNDTTSSGYPNLVAVELDTIYTYPKWTGTLYLEHYYREPTEMTADSDEPDLPNDRLRTQLIVTGVCAKHGFPHLNELVLADRYAAKYEELLVKYISYLHNSGSHLSGVAEDF